MNHPGLVTCFGSWICHSWATSWCWEILLNLPLQEPFYSTLLSHDPALQYVLHLFAQSGPSCHSPSIQSSFSHFVNTMTLATPTPDRSIFPANSSMFERLAGCGHFYVWFTSMIRWWIITQVISTEQSSSHRHLFHRTHLIWCLPILIYETYLLLSTSLLWVFQPSAHYAQDYTPYHQLSISASCTCLSQTKCTILWDSSYPRLAASPSTKGL